MTCVIAGCARKVEPRWCMCGEHWRIVPEYLRAPLSRAYNPHVELGDQAGGFHTALARVQGWIRETFGTTDDRPRRSWETLVASVRERDADRAAARGLRALSFSAASATSAPDDEPAPTPAQMRLL